MKAVILAGGKGMRLRPFTSCMPKPLMPIGDEMPIIEIVIRQLAAQGFTEISLVLGHMGDLIRSFVGDGSKWGVSIDCWGEDEPQGTAGPLFAHLDELPDDFLVMNADLLCNLDMGAMLRLHRKRGARLTIASQARAVKSEYGVLDVDGGRLLGFREKPEMKVNVSMGIYAVSRLLLEETPGRIRGFDDLLLSMLARADRPHIHRFDGYWLDIGRPEDYDRANNDFASLRDVFLPGGTQPVVVGDAGERRVVASDEVREAITAVLTSAANGNGHANGNGNGNGHRKRNNAA